jgi:two-component system sensor histidine kinase DctS
MPNRPAPVLHAAAPSLAVAAYRSAQRRRWLWAGLVVLLLVAQSLLLWLTIAFEGNRRQDQADGVASQTAAEIKGRLGRMVQDLQVLTWDDDASAQAWLQRARQALRQHAELARLERRSPLRELTLSADSPLAPPLFVLRPRESLPFEAETACASAGRLSAPHYSATYFVPLPDGRGQEVMELCLPQMTAGRPSGYVVATLTLGPLLEAVLPTAQSQRYELSFVESDGARLVRAGAPRAPGLYRAERLVDLPGHSLQLRVDSAQGAPSWVPNLPVALVGGLTLAPSRWRSGRRWRTRWSLACAHATCAAGSPTSTRRSARWSASVPRNSWPKAKAATTALPAPTALPRPLPTHRPPPRVVCRCSAIGRPS